jgi:hypothetical protein
LDVFNRQALSSSWNMMIFKQLFREALATEILESRLFLIDTSKAPIINVRKMQESPGRFYYLGFNCAVPRTDELIKHLKVLMKHKIDFYLYRLLPHGSLGGIMHENGIITEHIPDSPRKCLAAARIEGYSLVVCPPMEKEISVILKRLDSFWKVRVEKDPLCHCAG